MRLGVTVSRFAPATLVERYRRIGLGLAMKRARPGSVPGTRVADWPAGSDGGREAVVAGLPSTSGLARQPLALAALADDGVDQLPGVPVKKSGLAGGRAGFP